MEVSPQLLCDEFPDIPVEVITDDAFKLVMQDNNTPTPPTDQEIQKQKQFLEVIRLSEIVQQTDKLWSDAYKSDNQLGRYKVGPSPQQLSRASAQALIYILGRILCRSQIPDLDYLANCLFIDIGCCQGLVCAMAALQGFGRVYGVEICEISSAYAQKMFRERLPNNEVVIDNQDVSTNRWSLDSVYERYRNDPFAASVVYAFDRDFPPDVMRALVVEIAENIERWSLFVSARREKYWRDLPRNRKEQAAVNRIFKRTVLVYTQKTRLARSGECHTLYYYMKV